MRLLRFRGLVLLYLLLSLCGWSQTVKYNTKGDLIWIGSLMPDITGCGTSKLFTGTVSSVESFDGQNSVGYELTLRLPSNKQQKVQASLSTVEGATIPDLEEMIARGHRLKIKARACGSGGFWTAEDVWRL